MARNTDAKGDASNQDLIFGNLGLSGEDLGVGGDDDSTGPDDAEDDGADSSDRASDSDTDDSGDDNLDDMRMGSEDDSEDVSHNREEEEDEPAHIPTFRKPDVKADKRGNLLNKDGVIVARAGREARLYQRAYKDREALYTEKAHSQDVTGRLHKAIDIGTRLANRIKEMETTGGDASAKQLGLSPSESIEALQMFHLGKTNPKELLKKVLTRAAVAGIDVKDLGLTGGFDPANLAQLISGEISKHMTPLQEQQKRQREQEEVQRQAEDRRIAVTREVSDFFRENRDAVQYQPVFKAILSQPQFANMSLGEVWARIQLNLLRQRKPNSRDRRGQRSLPGGTRSAPNGRGSGNTMASLDASYDQILRGVLDDANVH